MSSRAGSNLGLGGNLLLIGGEVIGTQQAVHGVVDVTVMNPFHTTGDPFQLESQTFWNCPAAGVLGGTLDEDAVEPPSFEAVRDHRPTASCHNALSLMRGVQPIGQSRPAVGPVNIQMVDDSAKAAFKPDAGIEPAIVRILLLPVGDGFFHHGHGINEIHPRVPAPDMPSVGIKEFEQLGAVLAVNQPQLNLFVNFATKHVLK